MTSLNIAFSNAVAVSLLFIGWLYFTPIHKKKWLNVLESSFLLNLWMLCISNLYFDSYHDHYKYISSILIYFLVRTAFVTFIGIVSYHIFIQLYIGEFQPCSRIQMMITRTNQQDGTASDDSIDDILVRWPWQTEYSSPAACFISQWTSIRIKERALISTPK